ncbi:thioesterase II family protein [Streptomyces sp. NPDC059649]|uniref:thioesterase II family protein n=1 Tax=Streptomyces sp. NPDC059649 TaxID=3346895 RepID=UPI0036AD9575
MTNMHCGAPLRTGWIRRYHQPADDDLTLVCFAHAGGAATAYFSLSAALSASADVLVVQYPGRQDRLNEPAVTDLRQLADRIVTALEPWRDRSLAFFGHSMGAIVAYEVALRMERGQGAGPVGLIVSGSTAPSLQRDAGVHLMNDEELTAQMAQLAGTPPALLADEDFLATVLPSMRSDFTAMETYKDTAGSKLSCPISGYAADRDPRVSCEGLLTWGEYTTAGLTIEIFEGDHFYLHSPEQEQKVTRCLTRDLAAFTRHAAARPRSV